jgi:S1-C subfamily serine protease
MFGKAARVIERKCTSRGGGRSKPPGNIVGNDGIPIAQPVSELPLWVKAAGGLVVVLVVLGVVLMILPSGEKPAPPQSVTKQAQKLFEEINGLLNSVPYNIRGVEPARLFGWKGQLHKAIGKCDEILSLTADEEQAIERLADIHRQARQRKEPVSARIAHIENELLPAVQDSDKPVDMFPRVTPSVPIVRHARGRGSGFLIEHDGKFWVVTNRHVVSAADKDGVRLDFLLGDPSNPSSSTISIPLKDAVGAIHREADLALIGIPDSTKLQYLIKKHRVITLKLRLPRRPPQVMDNIWAVGHPGDHIALTVTKGDITAIKREYYGQQRHHGKVIQISAEITHGNSGCPVFDNNGRVIGIATFGKKGPGGAMLNCAIHVEALWKLLTTPALRLSAEETATMLRCNQYRMEMEKSGWTSCSPPVMARNVRWNSELMQWGTSCTWMFKAKAQKPYTVLAVSDRQYKISVSVVRLTGNLDEAGRPEMEAIRTLNGSGKMPASFKLDADANCMISVSGSDPSRPKKYWPVNVEVFQRTSLPSKPEN